MLVYSVKRLIMLYVLLYAQLYYTHNYAFYYTKSFILSLSVAIIPTKIYLLTYLCFNNLFVKIIYPYKIYQLFCRIFTK